MSSQVLFWLVCFLYHQEFSSYYLLIQKIWSDRLALITSPKWFEINDKRYTEGKVVMILSLAECECLKACSTVRKSIHLPICFFLLHASVPPGPWKISCHLDAAHWWSFFFSDQNHLCPAMFPALPWQVPQWLLPQPVCRWLYRTPREWLSGKTVGTGEAGLRALHTDCDGAFLWGTV